MTDLDDDMQRDARRRIVLRSDHQLGACELEREFGVVEELPVAEVEFGESGLQSDRVHSLDLERQKRRGKFLCADRDWIDLRLYRCGEVELSAGMAQRHILEHQHR